MKKLPFLLFCLLFYALQLSAQTHPRANGANDAQELGEAVFNALKENRFDGLTNYLPQENELRILRRRSSVDMRALLDQTTPDSIKLSLQRNFNNITAQTTANTFNWHNWQLADVKATQIDKKNRLLYRVQVTIANLEGARQQLIFEAVRIRGNYFLFKQLIFKGAN